jgi:hypothetical protein
VGQPLFIPRPCEGLLVRFHPLFEWVHPPQTVRHPSLSHLNCLFGPIREHHKGYVTPNY